MQVETTDRLDVVDITSEVREAVPDNCEAGICTVFVQHTTAGIVLTVSLDTDADQSRLLVLDGERFEGRAWVMLPHAAPFDFHGRYFPELRVTSSE